MNIQFTAGPGIIIEHYPETTHRDEAVTISVDEAFVQRCLSRATGLPTEAMGGPGRVGQALADGAHAAAIGDLARRGEQDLQTLRDEITSLRLEKDADRALLRSRREELDRVRAERDEQQMMVNDAAMRLRSLLHTDEPSLQRLVDRVVEKVKRLELDVATVQAGLTLEDGAQ